MILIVIYFIIQNNVKKNDEKKVHALDEKPSKEKAGVDDVAD